MKNVIFVKCIMCEKERPAWSAEAALINVNEAYPAKLIGYIQKKGSVQEGTNNVYLCKTHYDKAQDAKPLLEEQPTTEFLERVKN